MTPGLTAALVWTSDHGPPGWSFGAGTSAATMPPVRAAPPASWPKLMPIAKVNWPTARSLDVRGTTKGNPEDGGATILSSVESMAATRRTTLAA